MRERVDFERLHHLVTVPVAVNGIASRFVLDSGIGLTVLSTALCDAAGCEATGARFSGRRMSGQEVELPLALARSLRFGPVEREDVEVGVLDLSGFPSELAQIGGFLSLAFFADLPFTVEYGSGSIAVETADSLHRRLSAGVALDVRVEREGPSVTAFLPLTIPGGRSICVEVDMGSDELILDERLAGEVGVELGHGDVRRVEGVDETGNSFVRYFTSLRGSIHPTAASGPTQDDPAVMFQRIIHDGLIGDAFLRRFAVTYDLAASRLILS